jgi:hypothetical protein
MPIFLSLGLLCLLSPFRMDDFRPAGRDARALPELRVLHSDDDDDEADPAADVWDGIHQIVSRFLERFRYMCPLLFSCVFPS